MSGVLLSAIAALVVLIAVLTAYLFKKGIKGGSETAFDDRFEVKRGKYRGRTDRVESAIDACGDSGIFEPKCFIGIGGGGSKIVESINEMEPRHKYIYIDSNPESLQWKSSKDWILLGCDKKSDLGCDDDAKGGAEFLDNRIREQLRKFTDSYEKVYVIATLGGLVGSGATAEIIEHLKSLGKDISVFVTLPFGIEGEKRAEIAQKALDRIQNLTDKVTIFDNNDLIQEAEVNKLSIEESLNLIAKSICDHIV
jgi:cell division GTPase FtsZ